MVRLLLACSEGLLLLLPVQQLYYTHNSTTATAVIGTTNDTPNTSTANATIATTTASTSITSTPYTGINTHSSITVAVEP
jgi:hypothetical protein